MQRVSRSRHSKAIMLRVAVVVPMLVALSTGGLHAQNPTDSSAPPPAAAPPAVTPPAVTPAPIDTGAPPLTQPPSQNAASPASPAPSPKIGRASCRERG